MIELKLILDNLIQFFDTPFGVTTFIFLYALWVIILLPGLWPSMLGGLLYGQFFGSIIVFFGACIGAEITFLLSRRFFQKWTQKRISNFPKFKSIQRAVSKEGLRLVIFTRLSPAFPFSLLNLVYGLSEVSFRDFNIGLIGILPGTILFCGLGSLAGDIAKFNEVLSSKEDITSYLFSIIGVLATLIVVYLSYRAARKALQELESSV